VTEPRWYYSRSSTELDASTPPLGILNILQDFFNLIFERNYPDWVGIRFPKDGTHSGNVVSGLQINLLTENPGVAFDPVPTEVFDPLDVRIRNARLVGKVET